VAGAGDQQRDFFISYTSADRAWAEWVAWQLEEAGYSTVLQAWDFAPGDNFVERMHEALEQADRTIALLSQAYLASPYATDEWTGAFLHDPQHVGRLLPVRIEDCRLPRLLATRVYIDLVALGRQAARTRLLEGVQRGRRRPKRAPVFPGERRGGGGGVGEPRFPAHGPAITNLPARNPHFTGRSDTLEALRARLRAEPGVVVTQTGAIHGLGGVGKTELALEFAHRYQADYDLVWWISAEQPTSVTADLAALAEELGIERVADQAEMVELLFRELRGRERWLLVYDNAERPKALEGLLPPGGGGRVLVTSRYGAWGKLGATERLDVLARTEAVAFLARRTGATNQAVLDALANELGDLPLALEEAAAYLEETPTDIGEYLELVRERARELFGLDQPPADGQGDQRRVATVWSLSLERVRAEAPAAEALLNLCAFLAPDIPRDLPREQPQLLSEELAQAVGDPLAYNRMLAVVGRYSLATVSPTTLGVHRLVQAVLRARLGPDGERAWAEAAVGLLFASFPNESGEVDTWQTCERLLPHVLAAAEHAERLGVGREQAGWLLGRASRYLRGRGQYQLAKPIAERALAVTQAAVGPADPEVARRRDELGMVLYDLADLAGAREQLVRAVAIGEAALGLDDPAMAVWRNDLGGVLQDLDDLEGARVQLERAVAIGEAALGPGHRYVAVYHGNLGRVLLALGDLEGAQAQYERALAISEAALGPDHLDVATGRGNLGRLLQDLGDLEGARVQLERALAIDEAVLGRDHPEVAIDCGNLGGVLQYLGDLEGARAQFERALEISGAVLSPDHPDVATYRNRLGSVLRDLGDLAGARAHLERSLEMREAALGPDHATMAIRRGNLGLLLQDLGDLAGARAQLERALQIGEAALGPDHPTVATIRGNLNSVLQALQQPPPEGPSSAL
jgi:tetratricopeptide (TPR) repeat protein